MRCNRYKPWELDDVSMAIMVKCFIIENQLCGKIVLGNNALQRRRRTLVSFCLLLDFYLQSGTSKYTFGSE